MCACFSFLVVRIHKQPQDNRRSAHISVYMLWTIDVCLLFLPCRTDTLTVPGQPQVCSYICLHAVDSRCVLAFPSLSYRYTDSPRTTTGPFIYVSMLWTRDVCLRCLPCHRDFHVGSRSVGGELCDPWTQTL